METKDSPRNMDLDRGEKFLASLLKDFDCMATKAYKGTFPSVLVMVNNAMKISYSQNKSTVYYQMFVSFVSVPSHSTLGLFWVSDKSERLSVVGVSFVSNIAVEPLCAKEGI
mgnify:CR=1 FL=1